MAIVMNNNVDKSPQIIMVKTDVGLQKAFAKLALWLVANNMKEIPAVFEDINTMIGKNTLYTINMVKKNGSSKTVLYVSPAIGNVPKTVHVSKKYTSQFKQVYGE